MIDSVTRIVDHKGELNSFGRVELRIIGRYRIIKYKKFNLNRWLKKLKSINNNK